MKISENIKSKLRGAEEVSFEWLEEISTNKKYRLASGRTFYRGFTLNGLTVYEGNFVHINIGFSCGAIQPTYEIAKILKCYALHSPKKDKIRGYVDVQWFLPIMKIRSHHRKYIPSDLPPLSEDYDVVKDMWSYENCVDVETICMQCCVVEVTGDVSPNMVERPHDAVGPLYVCRFKYQKEKPWVVPFTKSDISKSHKDESVVKLKEITNTPKKWDDLSNSDNRNSNSPVMCSKSKKSNSLDHHESSNLPFGMCRRVKRKLLDPDEGQENCPKRSKREKNTVTENGNEPFLSPLKLKSPKRVLNTKETIVEDDLENRNNISACRGLYCAEISNLLEDEVGGREKAKRKTHKITNKKSLKKRSEISITTTSHSVKEERDSPKCKEERDSPKCKEEKRSDKHDRSLSKRTPKPTGKMKDYTNSKAAHKISVHNRIETNNNLLSEKEESEVKAEQETPRKLKKKNKNENGKTKGKKDTSKPLEKRVNHKRETRKSPKRDPTPKKCNKLALAKRETPVECPATEFEVARANLHVSAVPSFLPCREEEFQQIYSFVEGKLLDSIGGCMYVSGVPGTGKTATVREVVRLLQECQKEETVPQFKFLEVNAMKLTKPHDLWVQIWEGLTGEKATATHSYALIEKYLGTPSGPKRRSIFLLLDELDLLWTRKQDVMYNLFELSSRVGSRLIVVTIANTMDLPERMMISRVSSRLGLTRMTFQPYSFKQLQEIIVSRLMGIKAFDPDAIQLVARKVAAISGDARRALDLCRRATEIAEKKKVLLFSPTKTPEKARGLVGIAHVTMAIEEMFTSPKIMAVRCCSEMEIYTLQAILTEFTRTGIEEAVFMRVLDHLESICRLAGVTPPSSSEALKLVSALSSQKILLTEHSKLDLMLRIRLNISTDDASYALNL